MKSVVQALSPTTAPASNQNAAAPNPAHDAEDHRLKEWMTLILTYGPAFGVLCAFAFKAGWSVATGLPLSMCELTAMDVGVAIARAILTISSVSLLDWLFDGAQLKTAWKRRLYTPLRALLISAWITGAVYAVGLPTNVISALILIPLVAAVLTWAAFWRAGKRRRTTPSSFAIVAGIVGTSLLFYSGRLQATAPDQRIIPGNNGAADSLILHLVPERAVVVTLDKKSRSFCRDFRVVDLKTVGVQVREETVGPLTRAKPGPKQCEPMKAELAPRP